MKKRGIRMLIISIFCLTLASCMILLMPLVAEQINQEISVMAYVIAGVFWFATIVGYVAFYRSRAWLLELKKRDKYKEQKLDTGIRKIPFANSKIGLIFNIMFALSVIVYIFTQVIFEGSEIMAYICIFIFILSFHMQFIFNSETFISYIDIQKGKVNKDE